MMNNKFNFLKLSLLSFFLVTSFSLILGGSQTAFANEENGVETPKWTRDLPSDTCPNTSDTNCHWGSPVIAKIDGDDFPDIVAVTNKGYVVAVRHDGSLIWQNDIADEFGMAAGKHEITSSPAVADIDKDGYPEIVVGVGSSLATSCTVGGLIVLNHLGNMQWRFIAVAENDQNCVGWPDSIFSTPALADLDGDGYLEIIAGGFDRRIYAWDYQGNFVEGFPPDSVHRERFPTWPNLRGSLADTIWGSPAVADLTGNGQLDILIGTDEGDFGPNWPGDPNGFDCPYEWAVNYCGGLLYGLTAEGQLLKHFDPAYDFPRTFFEIVQSTPAIADVNNDGFPEIFVGSGSFYYVNSPDHPTDYFRLYGMDRFGNDLPGWGGGRPLGGPTPASPTIGDITGDGKLDIIMGSLNEKKLYAYHANGTLISGFPMTPKAQNGIAFDTYNVGATFILGDYDGDGDMEIFVTQGWGVSIIDGNGQQLTMTNYPNDNRPLYLTDGTVISNPALGDIDNDGKLEMVITNSKMYVWDLDGSSDEADWPMFKRDAARTSAFPSPPSMLAAPNPVTAYHQTGQGGNAQTSFVIRNTGGAAFTWTANTPSGVTANPSSGTVPPGGTTIVMVTVQAGTTMPPGTYPQGNLTVNANSDEGPVLNGNLTIPIVLVVGEISQTFIPVVQK